MSTTLNISVTWLEELGFLKCATKAFSIDNREE
jgi:hypothetical protein